MSKQSTIGDRIKTWREKSGLSQNAMAEKLGISRVALTKWESGQTENMKLANLVALCHLMKTTAELLITGKSTSSTYNISNAVPVPLNEPEPQKYSPIPRELSDLYESLSEQGRWELIGQARLLATLHPRDKTLATSGRLLEMPPAGETTDLIKPKHPA